MRFMARVSPLIVWVVMTGSAAHAWADPSPAEGAGANASSPSETQLTEIVVTAEKRSERINDVPQSISAATGNEMRNLGITDVAQLTKVVPGLTYQQTGYGTPVYTIRGIGNYVQSQGVVPAASEYIDQVPLPFGMMTRGVALDLERVEV